MKVETEGMAGYILENDTTRQGLHDSLTFLAGLIPKTFANKVANQLPDELPLHEPLEVEIIISVRQKSEVCHR